MGSDAIKKVNNKHRRELKRRNEKKTLAMEDLRRKQAYKRNRLKQIEYAAEDTA